MERLIKGDVVVIPFPFTDLTGMKKRPAFVVSTLKGNDFLEGGLKQESNVRPNKLFTADEDLILYKIGRLNEKKIKEVIEKIIAILIA